MRLDKFRHEIEEHVKNNILKFWTKKAFDYEKNNLYGWVVDDLEGNTVATAMKKTSIFPSRILWVFSNAYERFKNEEYKRCAYICYDNLMRDFYDNENEGVYSNTTDMSADANYAVAMIIDDVVVEIYVIK